MSAARVVNRHWTDVGGRLVYTDGCPAVIVSAEEADRFPWDDELQRQCANAAAVAGVHGVVACQTIAGFVAGSVTVLSERHRDPESPAPTGSDPK